MSKNLYNEEINKVSYGGGYTTERRYYYKDSIRKEKDKDGEYTYRKERGSIYKNPYTKKYEVKIANYKENKYKVYETETLKQAKDKIKNEGSLF